MDHTIDQYKIKDNPSDRIRLIHTLRFNFSKKLNDVETAVNTEIIKLALKGCKIVSVQSKQVGLNPIYLFYEIIYEPGEDYTKKLLEVTNDNISV